MGQELAIRTTAQPLMGRTMSDVNYDILDKVAEAYQQMTGQDNRLPGERLQFKQGAWVIEGNIKNTLEAGTELIANMPNLVFAWRQFRTSQSGKMYPHYEAVAYPLSGEALPPRETLGDTDQDDWELYNGKPKDPWSMVVILVLRDDQDDDRLYRLELDNKSSVNAIRDLLGEFAKEARMHMNQLPVIALGSDWAERKTDEGETQRWQKPVFDIVAWEDPTEADDVDLGGDDAADDGGDAAAEEEPAPKKSRKAKAEADDKPARKSRKAKPEPEAEPEVEEDDDQVEAVSRTEKDTDDQPKPTQRRRRRAQLDS